MIITSAGHNSSYQRGKLVLMVSAGRQPATYQDVLDAPEGMVAELIHGELHLQPRPAKRHGRAASVLGMILGPSYHLGVNGPGGWEIQHEPEVHFGPQVLVPDLAGWRLSIADPNADLSVAYFTTVPQWVCEVLSKSTAKKDRDQKLPIYANAGVEHAWLIDPQRRMLEVFALREGRYRRIRLHEGPGSFSAEPFDEAVIDANLLWVG